MCRRKRSAPAVENHFPEEAKASHETCRSATSLNGWARLSIGRLAFHRPDLMKGEHPRYRVGVNARGLNPIAIVAATVKDDAGRALSSRPFQDLEVTFGQVAIGEAELAKTVIFVRICSGDPEREGRLGETLLDGFQTGCQLIEVVFAARVARKLHVERTWCFLGRIIAAHVD